MKNVELHNFALSDEIGEIDFYIGHDDEILLASIIKERGGNKNIKIQAKKISNYIKGYFDLIKIDVEGSEIQILNDLVLSKKMNSFKNYIIEYHHKINYSKASLSTFIKPFEEHGFDYNIKTSFSKKGIFQDILLNIYKGN